MIILSLCCHWFLLALMKLPARKEPDGSYFALVSNFTSAQTLMYVRKSLIVILFCVWEYFGLGVKTRRFALFPLMFHLRSLK